MKVLGGESVHFVIQKNQMGTFKINCIMLRYLLKTKHMT